MMAVGVTTSPAFSAAKPTRLFEDTYDFSGNQAYANYDVAPDGRFLLVKQVPGESFGDLVVVLNWLEELKRRISLCQLSIPTL